MLGEDEATGLRERIVIESKDKTHVPNCHILDEKGEIIRTYSFPINGHIVVEDGQELKASDITGLTYYTRYLNEDITLP